MQTSAELFITQPLILKRTNPGVGALPALRHAGIGWLMFWARDFHVAHFHHRIIVRARSAAARRSMIPGIAGRCSPASPAPCATTRSSRTGCSGRWGARAAQARRRRRRQSADGRHPLADGLPAIEAACAEATAQGVHSVDFILSILARHRNPGPPIMILSQLCRRCAIRPLPTAQVMTTSGVSSNGCQLFEWASYSSTV